MADLNDLRVVRYIMNQHPSMIAIYVFTAFNKRNINVRKVLKKLNEVYGDNYTGEQFVEFGKKYLDAYMIEKHNITFDDLLVEAFKPIINRFRHLA